MEKITLQTIGGGNERNSGSSSEQIVAHDTSDTAHAAIRELFKSGASEIKAALAELGDNYKDLYTLANTLKTFLEARDTADDTINTWREIEDFLNGLTDRDSLTGLMGQEHSKLREYFEDSLSSLDNKKVGSSTIRNIAGPMTASQYVALTKNANTLYIITD